MNTNLVTKCDVHEAVVSNEPGVEWMVLVAALVKKLGGEVLITIEDLEDVVASQAFEVERNDPMDVDAPQTLTLRVSGYEPKQIN